MKLADFNYHLPPALIATEPAKKRDQSRLLVLDKVSGKIKHQHFFDIIDYLQPGDLLVANNSKVIPARLLGKKSTGGEVEVFLSKKVSRPHPDPLLGKEREIQLHSSSPLLRGRSGGGEVWECLVKGRVKAGTIIVLSKKMKAEIVKVLGEGISLVKFNLRGTEFMKEVDKIGHIPLPPYIEKKRRSDPTLTLPFARGGKLEVDDKLDYQTVYAEDLKKGSVAAPTAGLHFTPELIKKIKAKGVAVEYLTLHVGLGTFLPVKTEKIEEHKIHTEYAEVSAQLIKKIIATKKRGGRIVAVGTTTTRTLEYVFSSLSLRGAQRRGNPVAMRSPRSFQSLAMTEGFVGWIDIFIYPPYKFKIVDALITNFHLPKSTLLMLVSALADKKNIDKAYREAIKAKYRFYSYGDAMLIK